MIPFPVISPLAEGIVLIQGDKRMYELLIDIRTIGIVTMVCLAAATRIGLIYGTDDTFWGLTK